MSSWLSRATLVSTLVTLALVPVRAQQTAPQPAVDLHATLPLDPHVKVGTLANGLTYYVRHNSRPANRVLLRLAVKAGSLDEADDQQGLAHMLEHMAFNGSEHFKPGELISYFESIGARLGPHVNAYTSFEETVFMLDLPSDKTEVVQKGFTAFADFAGGLTLDPAAIDKERGVVIEEWRGGLGAGSRVRDKEIPVLYYHSRFAERLPIGKPEILRTFAPARLKAFYDTFYRPERMAVIATGDMDQAALEQMIKTTFGGLHDRTSSAPPRNDAVPLHKETLVAVVTDPELTQSSVTLIHERPRQYETSVADYRRDLLERFYEQMLNDRFDELTRRPDAKFLGAGLGGENLSKDVDSVSLAANTQNGRILDGLSAITIEAKRARDFGFSASELDRAKKWMEALYQRAYAERDKTESSQFAQEYLSLFLERDPSPGIDYEYKLIEQLLPGIGVAEVSALGQTLLGQDSRVLIATSPEKAGITAPTDEQMRQTVAAAEAVSVTPWNDTTATKPLVEHEPTAATVVSTRTVDEIGLTVVRFSNGVEAWLKPTDFKNDQVLFSMQAKGGLSLAAPADYPEASLAAGFQLLSGTANLKALDLQKMLAGKILNVSPYASLSTHGLSGSAEPSQLETALQLLYARFTEPGDDPEAFELMKRQLGALVANRLASPEQVFADKVEEVNTQGHYISTPLTTERVNALDRTKMLSFYKDRFRNAGDFTFFMVGTFKVDEVLPLLEKYVGGLPSSGAAMSNYKDLHIEFPASSTTAAVKMGSEPKAETVISYFAQPHANDPMEQEVALAMTDTLEIGLRDILREELGQTYTVSVDLSQLAPQVGDDHVEISFGAAPENIDKMTARVREEIEKMKKDGPTDDLLNRAKETARRNYETQLKQNAYWLGRFQAVKLWGQDPVLIAHRNERIAAVTAAAVKAAYNKYFPEGRSTDVTLMPAK